MPFYQFCLLSVSRKEGRKLDLVNFYVEYALTKFYKTTNKLMVTETTVNLYVQKRLIIKLA